jgi:hypothetical protein
MSASRRKGDKGSGHHDRIVRKDKEQAPLPTKNVVKSAQRMRAHLLLAYAEEIA